MGHGDADNENNERWHPENAQALGELDQRRRFLSQIRNHSSRFSMLADDIARLDQEDQERVRDAAEEVKGARAQQKVRDKQARQRKRENALIEQGRRSQKEEDRLEIKRLKANAWKNWLALVIVCYLYWYDLPITTGYFVLFVAFLA